MASVAPGNPLAFPRIRIWRGRWVLSVLQSSARRRVARDGLFAFGPPGRRIEQPGGRATSDMLNLRRAIPAVSRALRLLPKLSFTLVATFLCLPALLMAVCRRVPVNPRHHPLEPYSYAVEPPKYEQDWDSDDQIER